MPAPLSPPFSFQGFWVGWHEMALFWLKEQMFWVEMFLRILLPYSALWLQKIHLAGCNETIKHRLFTDFVKTELTSSYERIKNNYNSKSTKHHTYSHTVYSAWHLSLHRQTTASKTTVCDTIVFDNESSRINQYQWISFSYVFTLLFIMYYFVLTSVILSQFLWEYQN